VERVLDLAGKSQIQLIEYVGVRRKRDCAMIHEPRGRRILTLAAALADPVSGTVPNRFASQAAIGHPLDMCDGGTWARGIIGICDTVRCIQLACENPANRR
jgi:hypothetical protein